MLQGSGTCCTVSVESKSQAAPAPGNENVDAAASETPSSVPDHEQFHQKVGLISLYALLWPARRSDDKELPFRWDRHIQEINTAESIAPRSAKAVSINF